MKDYESGFLALILAGILVMIIGLGLMATAVRSPDNAVAGIIAQGAKTPSQTPSTQAPSTRTPASLLAMLGVQPTDGAAPPKR